MIGTAIDCAASAAVVWFAFHYFATLGIPKPALHTEPPPVSKWRIIVPLLVAVAVGAFILGALWL